MRGRHDPRILAPSRASGRWPGSVGVVSTLLHPVGSKPPGTYWVRRVLVLLVVLALILGIRQVFFSGDATSSATPTPSGSTSAAPDPSESASAPSSTASPKPSSSATSGTGACKDSQIQVTASTDAASYQVGSTPLLRMRIKNVSKSACKRDIGSKSNELIITSGAASVWSSDDCNPGGNAQVVTLKPDQSYSVNVTWLGRLSQKGCPPDQPIASAGTYKLVGRNGNVTLRRRRVLADLGGVRAVGHSHSSWRSERSVLSIASTGSVLSIASTGSVLSIGSIGSAVSVGSIGSVLSLCSILSAGSGFSALSYRSYKAAMAAHQGRGRA